MKLSEIENRKFMDMVELRNCFRTWFPNGCTKEEGFAIWTIFSNNNRYYHIPTNKIIETGTFRWFGDFIAMNLCNENSNYLDFYCSNYHVNTDILKEIMNIVKDDIAYIEDFWNDDYDDEILKLEKQSKIYEGE